MAETTTAAETPEPDATPVEPAVPNVVGVLVVLSCSERIQHDYGFDWDIADGYLRVIGKQTGGRTRDIAEYAPHSWEHVSFVFESEY